MSDPTVRVTRYEVSCLPLDNINAPHFTITVEWRGSGKWAVLRLGDCLGSDGVWDYEPNPSSREPEWLETHRFDLDTALTLAKDAAPKLTVNGYTVASVLARGRVVILPTAAAIALATIAAAWLHGTFAPDPGIHRPIRTPGPIGRCAIALTHTQPIPVEVRRRALAGPKERT